MHADLGRRRPHSPEVVAARDHTHDVHTRRRKFCVFPMHVDIDLCLTYLDMGALIAGCMATGAGKRRDMVDYEDVSFLEMLGYKQELYRGMQSYMNFAVNLTCINAAAYVVRQNKRSPLCSAGRHVRTARLIKRTRALRRVRPL